MKIAFWGTPELSVPILEELYQSSHSILAVITQPDRCQGKHRSTTCFSPVKKFAVEKNIPVFQPESAKEEKFCEEIQKIPADVMIVAAYGEILPKCLLRAPKYGFVNVHFSLLPKYRGASPIVSALLAGDVETGVSIMQVVSKLDAGPVYGQKTVPISPTDTKGSLEKKLSDIAGTFLLEILAQIEAGTIIPHEQEHSQATFCSIIQKENGEICWDWPAEKIERHIRAMQPWPLAYSYLDSKQKGKTHLIIHHANVISNYMNIVASPGEIVQVNKDNIAVMTGKDLLAISHLQRAGKNILHIKEFLQGTKVEIGEKFIHT